MEAREVSTDIIAPVAPSADLPLLGGQLSTQTIPLPHHPDAGINSLVDTAARLFSLAGKLSQLKSCLNPSQLQQQLIAEITAFQETLRLHGHTPEQLLACSYAICSTLDDILLHTPWGLQGQWHGLRLTPIFNPDAGAEDRFFVILERLLQDPERYAELLEYMYFCLSLGFRGSYRGTEFSRNQLDHICDTLYQHIRGRRGDFSKTLTPFPVKPHAAVARKSTHVITRPTLSASVIIMFTACIILFLFAGLGYWLEFSSAQTQHTLTQLGYTLTHVNLHT